MLWSRSQIITVLRRLAASATENHQGFGLSRIKVRLNPDKDETLAGDGSSTGSVVAKLAGVLSLNDESSHQARSSAVPCGTHWQCALGPLCQPGSSSSMVRKAASAEQHVL